MTYYAASMDDDHWLSGTLRIWYGDDRQTWGVTEPHDKDFGTAVICWGHSGEFYDGTRWRPMKERGAWLDSKTDTVPPHRWQDQ